MLFSDCCMLKLCYVILSFPCFECIFILSIIVDSSSFKDWISLTIVIHPLFLSMSLSYFFFAISECVHHCEHSHWFSIRCHIPSSFWSLYHQNLVLQNSSSLLSHLIFSVYPCPLIFQFIPSFWKSTFTSSAKYMILYPDSPFFGNCDPKMV